jgi:uncharacterized protein YndB with AHSA1/START domain
MITIATTINANIQTVWDCFNNPVDIIKWNSASPDWHTPKATNDLRVGGIFTYRMEAKDGSMGFDFWGTFTEVQPLQKLAYTLGDSRKVEVNFLQKENTVEVVEIFEPESENTIELQQMGWQAILDNFKNYVESK